MIENIENDRKTMAAKPKISFLISIWVPKELTAVVVYNNLLSYLLIISSDQKSEDIRPVCDNGEQIYGKGKSAF